MADSADSGRTAGIVLLVFLAAVVLGVGGTAVYWIWPTGITDVPLASLTLGSLVRAAGAFIVSIISLGIALMFVAWIFD